MSAEGPWRHSDASARSVRDAQCVHFVKMNKVETIKSLHHNKAVQNETPVTAAPFQASVMNGLSDGSSTFNNTTAKNGLCSRKSQRDRLKLCDDHCDGCLC